MQLISDIGPLIYPLAFFSILGAALIVERILFFIRQPKIDNCPIYEKLLGELIENKQQTKEIRDELLSYRLLDIKESFEFGIRFLRIIAVLSPMLGLLGTVIGMINAFKTISTHVGPVAPSLIADGLWNAMLTTAYGLIIALPCLFAAFVFSRMAEKRLNTYQHKLNAKSLKIAGVILHEESL